MFRGVYPSNQSKRSPILSSEAVKVVLTQASEPVLSGLFKIVKHDVQGKATILCTQQLMSQVHLQLRTYITTWLPLVHDHKDISIWIQCKCHWALPSWCIISGNNYQLHL